MRRIALRGFVLLLALGFLGAVSATPLAPESPAKIKKKISKAVQGGDVDAAIGFVKDLAATEDKKTISTLYDVGKTYAVTEKLYKVVIDEFVELEGALEWACDKFPKVKAAEKVFIGDMCAKVPERELARNTLILALDDSSVVVQSVGVKGLEKSMHHDAIEPLIDLLEKLSKKKRKDMIFHYVHEALYNLTYQDFDLITDWRNWWAPNEGNFDPKKLDETGKTGVERKKRGEDGDFFGVPVLSKNVVFVIDTSGSMRYVHKDDIPGLARGDGSDGGESSGGGRMSEEDKRLAEFWTRMEMAKRALKKCLEQLKSDTLFNIVHFDRGTNTFKKKAVAATPGNKKAALKYAATLKYKQNSATVTEQALIAAFNADKKTNTIFFLSDGLPSKDGKVNDPTGPILDKVFHMNRFRKITIHTFGFYPYTQSNQPMPALKEANDFLKKLAEATGGKYTDMKVNNDEKPPPRGS